MNINSTSAASSSTYVSNASSNKGFSGLASGLDTESMVEALLSGTQSKIDKQQQLRQQTVWKQELYRELITSINSFQSKYFSSSSSTSLLSQAFFNIMNATTTSNAFKVTATSSAAVRNTSIQVQQLATNTTITSGSQVSGKLEGTIDEAAIQKLVDEQLNASRTVVFEADGKEVSVDFTDVFVQTGPDGSKSFTNISDEQKAKQIAEKINAAFDGVLSGVRAEVKDGTLKIVSSAGTTVQVSSKSSEAGLTALGLTSGSRTQSSSSSSEGSMSGKLSLGTTFDFDIKLDDTQKTLRLDMTKFVTEGTNKVDLDKFVQEFESQLAKTHGAGQITLTRSGNTFELMVGQGRKVMIGGDSDVLSALGVKNGQSNRIGMGGALKDLYFSTELQGSRFEFSINGTKFSFDDNVTISEVMSAINSSDAGVRMVYLPADDKFSLETTDSGAGFDIQLEQTQGNLLNALFGSGKDGTLASGSSVASGELTLGQVKAEGGMVLSDDEFSEIKEGTFNITVNGEAFSFSLERKEDGYTKDEIISSLNSQMAEKFGDGNIVLNSDGSLSVNNGAKVSFAASDISDPDDPDIVKKQAQAGDLALAFGFGLKGADNAVSEDATLADLGLGGLGQPDGANTKLKDLSGNFSFVDGRIVVTGSTAGADPADLKKLFGTENISLGTVQGSQSEYSAGVNAKVVIDGVTTERSSNSFSYNGLNIDLVSTSPKDADGNFITETISVSRGTDQIVEGIKGFIEDYNELIGRINELLDEDTSYRDYPPLTDAQKKEMSEKEIELWEEKAKEGLLRNDSTLSGFVQSMRSILYEKPEGCSYALYNLGIETGEWEDKGKLVMSADGEARLRQVLESNPDEVMRLFTDEEEGIAVKLNKVIDETAKVSSADPGSLVSLAGVKGKASETQNTLYERLKEIDEKITTLKNSYEKEKERYWKQFNTMEQLISNMNTQSSWLAMQFS